MKKEDKHKSHSPSQDFPLDYAPGEELANGITHGLGTLVSLAGFGLLLYVSIPQSKPYLISSIAVYGTTLILCHLTSTLYHSTKETHTKKLFQLLDHGAIFLLIAGTYTPFLLVTVRGALGWSMFGVVWSFALGGIFFKAFFINRFPKAGASSYVLMGLLSVFLFNRLVTVIGLEGVLWIIAGGVLYVSGLIFLGWHDLKYNHTIWHLFVLGGAICHYISIFSYVLPAA